MPRKRAERGSIARLDRNRYRIRYWGDKGDGKGYRRLSANFIGTLTEARAERDRLIELHSTNQRTQHTVRYVFDTLYWPSCEKRLATNTLNVYRSTWRKYVGPKFGSCKLGTVKPLMIQEWLDGMTKAQAQRAVNMLSGIYKTAVKFELAETNPTSVGLTLPDNSVEMDKGIYDLAELMRMAELLRGSRMEGIFLLCAFGSCRPGEATAVDPASVELVKASNGMACAVVPIEREAVRGAVVDRVKTECSRRYVVVPGKWGERLAEVAVQRINGCHNLFIENMNGEPLSSATLKVRWESESNRLGFEYHPLRNLRNSWRTSWEYEVRIPTSTLEILMGHSGSGVSAKHYVRASLMMLVNTVADAFADAGLVS